MGFGKLNEAIPDNVSGIADAARPGAVHSELVERVVFIVHWGSFLGEQIFVLRHIG